jgi:hypothetical protein
MSYRSVAGIPSRTKERIMTRMHWLVVSAALAIGMAAPAPAAITDPEVIIYRFPGVRDNGAADNAGVATVFHCTNFSGVAENIRFVTRDSAGNLLTNMVFNVTHLATMTASTHPTALYLDSIAAEHRCRGLGDDGDCRNLEQRHLHGGDYRCVCNEPERVRVARHQIQSSSG